jgi:penicillin-binding protein 2
MGGRIPEARLGTGGEPPSELRIGIIALLMVLVFSLFGLRLFQLQILEGAELAGQSERNSVRTVRLEAPRGEIVDREGRVLATSRPAFRVQVIPSELQDRDETYGALGSMLEVDRSEIAGTVGRPTGRRRFQPVLIDGDLTDVEHARVETLRFALPGVMTDMQPRRHYVEGKLAAHLLGTIGEIGAKQLASERYQDYRQGETIGQFGLEARMEEHLRGRAGGRNVIVDVAGREMDVIEEVEPVPGGRVVLTLDLDLQRVAEQAFDETLGLAPEGEEPPKAMGALVALDPRNGDVLALVSRPAYDPNVFAGGITPDDWAALTGDEWNPLRNRAISGQYSPGSTYKPFVALAGLIEGKIDPETEVFCPGYFRLGRRVYRCWKRGGHGNVNLDSALAGSCDVYFYQLGVELGVDTLARYARAFGLGQRTRIALAGENEGLVPTRAWKEKARGEEWIKGETVSASIGQGFNLVTLVQLAVSYAALANGEKVFSPRLVSRLETWDGELVEEMPPARSEPIGLDPAAIARIRTALAGVVNAPGGTGRRARLPDVEVAGKTGTTQVVSLDLVKDLEPEEVPVRYRDHALFGAFAPAENPEIAVAVLVEHAGSGGGTVAAPIARAVLARFFEKRQQAIDAEEMELDGTDRVEVIEEIGLEEPEADGEAAGGPTIVASLPIGGRR